VEDGGVSDTRANLIGREAERRVVSGLLDDVRAGHGRTCLILGEAGIGKTTLVHAVAGDATAAGLSVHWGRCTEAESLPYWPWVQLFGGLLGDDGRQLLGPGRYAGRADLFASVADAVVAATGAGPTALFLEDLHWADHSSLELFRFLSSVVPGCPVLLVATAREEGAVVALSGLASSATLQLAGLDAMATGELMAEILGRSVSEEVVAEVRRRTGGNPFFVNEVTRLQMMRSGAPGLVPDGVRRTLEHRFARLPQQSVQTLQAASVLGRIDVPVLCVLTGRGAGVVRADLEEPRRALLVVDRDGALEFAHDLVREALYEGLSVRRRAELHRVAAQAMPDAEPAELAAHWHRADGADAGRQAAECAVRAGDAAIAMMAYEDAERFYRTALSLGTVDAIAAGLGLGRALMVTGRLDEGRARLRSVAAAAMRAGRPTEMAHAALALGGGLGGFEVDISDQSQADVLEDVLAALPGEDSALRAAVLARLSLAGAQRFAPDRCVELARSAVEMARRVGDQASEAAALAALCDALAGPDHVQERVAMSTRLLALARTIRDPSLELLGRRLRILAALEGGDFSGADADIVAYAHVAEHLRLALYRWQVPMWRGMRAAMDGDDDLALRYADEAASIGAEADSFNATLMVWALRLAVARRRADVASLDALLDEVLPYVGDYPPWDCAMAALHASAGRTGQARAYVERVMRTGLDAIPKDAEWLELLWLLADAAVATDDRDTAAAIRSAVAPYAELWVIDGIGAACFGRVSTLIDQLDSFAGRPTTSSPPGTEEQGVFARSGGLWQLRFRGREVTVVHTKGMADLAELLRRPGREVHVLDLYDADGGPDRARRPPATDTGPVLDATARSAYRARLAELDGEIAAAVEDADSARVDRLRIEQEFLLAELGQALGLGGRPRVSGDPVERARKAVTMRIATAVRAIDAAHPHLARHLRNSVSTGRFCSYRPDRSVSWRT
jgi:hypothetical protein